jgi:hypothetical protein
VYFSTNTKNKTLNTELCICLGAVDRSTVEKCGEAQAAYGGPARDPFTGAPYREAESCDVTEVSLTVFVSIFLPKENLLQFYVSYLL